MTQTAQTRYDAVIVGGGHNGLVAAAYLARAGKSVLVLEKSSTLGGATSSKRVFPAFDAHLSQYSYLVSLLPPRIVQDLGLRFETLRRSTASYTPYSGASGDPGALVLSNVAPAKSQASLEAMTGRQADVAGYARLLELETALAEKVWPTFLEPLKTKAEFESQMRSDSERQAWRSFVEEPLGMAIERHVRHDTLRGLIMTDGKIGVFTHPHDPTLLQNRCFLYHVIGGGDGEWRVPKGGMGALVRSLAEVCRSHGVEFVTSAEAKQVELGHTKHAITFELEGQERTVDADHILVNAGPRTFARLFGLPHTPDRANEGSVVKMNMLLKRLPRLKSGVASEEAFAGSFHIDEGYEQMIASYQTAANGSVPDPAPGEIYCHTLTDPSILSPELQAQGYQTLTLFGLDMPYRLFENDHDARKELVKQRFLDGLDRLCDEPIRDCIAREPISGPGMAKGDGAPSSENDGLCIEIKTPQDLEREVGLDQGNIFHTAPSWFFAENSPIANKRSRSAFAASPNQTPRSTTENAPGSAPDNPLPASADPTQPSPTGNAQERTPDDPLSATADSRQPIGQRERGEGGELREPGEGHGTEVAHGTRVEHGTREAHQTIEVHRIREEPSSALYEWQPGQWGVETPFPRVYLAGSSAHRGGAVSGIPGHNAAMAVLTSRQKRV